MDINDVLNMLGPFADGLAKSLVSKTAPEAEEAGENVGKFISDALHKTKTGADDLLVEENAKAFCAGFVRGLDAPAPQPGDGESDGA